MVHSASSPHSLFTINNYLGSSKLDLTLQDSPALQLAPIGCLADRGGGGEDGFLIHLQQILRTRAESQWIVTARSLCHLQYPVRAKSSAKDLPQGRMELSCMAPEQVLSLSRETNGYAPALGKTECILSRVTSLGKVAPHLACLLT